MNKSPRDTRTSRARRAHRPRWSSTRSRSGEYTRRAAKPSSRTRTCAVSVSRADLLPERRAFRRLARGIASPPYITDVRNGRGESEKSYALATSARRTRDAPPHLHLRWMGGEVVVRTYASSCEAAPLARRARVRCLRHGRRERRPACTAPAAFCTKRAASRAVGERRCRRARLARRRPTRRVQDVLRLIDSLIDFVHYVRHSATLSSTLSAYALLSPPRNAPRSLERMPANGYDNTRLHRRSSDARPIGACA